MIAKITVNDKEKILNLSKKKVVLDEQGEEKYYVGRILYYLLKSTYNVPRLYGYLKGEEPLESWKQTYENIFLQILRSDLEISSTYFKGKYELDLGAIQLFGTLNGKQISVNTIFKEKPIQISSGIQGNFQVDSFYYSKIEKIKPYIIPSSRSGLLCAFSKYLIYQYERGVGIPKTFGIAAEFVNSMLLSQSFSDEIEGHKIWINGDNIYVDDNVLYNATSNILSLLVLKIFLIRGTEKELIIIEEPEAHLNEEEKNLVKKWINETRSKTVIITNEKGQW